LKCCEHIGVKTVKDLYTMDLSIISVHKLRQMIQNKEGRFKPDEKVQKARHKRASEIKEYMKKIG
jgi:hypothetical protein